MAVKTVDLTGKRFGRLTVISRSYNRHSHSYWLCRCDCGKEKIIRAHSLIHGDSKSCGCLVGGKPKHGHYGERIYRIWDSMKARCNNPNAKSYPSYGGRGISICEEWKDFQPFYDWAMQNGYTDQLTIDRIDTNKNYSPDNCRWVNMLVQENNKTSNRYITYNGKTMSLSMWARELGISYMMLLQRLDRGWTFEKAISTPKQKRKVS